MDGKDRGYPTDKTNLVWEKIGKGLKESGKDIVSYIRYVYHSNIK